ncbi:MAG TPA: hypothetical protein ENN81_05980 [Phycisphaerales bacterium]|nr:hypothetical protein [Phycisphaerales bacterium]
MLRKLKNKLVRFAGKTIAAYHDRPLPPATQREQQLVEQLRADYAALDLSDPADVRESHAEWLENCRRVKELAFRDDPRSFLRWHVISGAMFPKNASYVDVEYKHLRSLPDWAGRWLPAVRENYVGHPLPYHRCPQSSPNLIHHAYHVARYEQATRSSVCDLDFVVEFGGGYGSLCRLFQNLGFSGRYVIFDLPVFTTLQRFYLQSIGLDVCSIESLTASADGIACVSNLKELASICSTRPSSGGSLFIALWSLSESPLHTRDEILPLVEPFGAWMIGYQSRFHEVDNLAFFEGFKTANPHIRWIEQPIEQMPGNRYLFGLADPT